MRRKRMRMRSMRMRRVVVVDVVVVVVVVVVVIIYSLPVVRRPDALVDATTRWTFAGPAGSRNRCGRQRPSLPQLRRFR